MFFARKMKGTKKIGRFNFVEPPDFFCQCTLLFLPITAFLTSSFLV